MQSGRLFLAIVIATAGLGFGASPRAAADDRWTLATDDTILTIGRDGQGRVAILELKNPAQQLNWIDKPAPIPLLSRVEVGGKSVTPDWAFQNVVVDRSDGTKVTLRFSSTTPKLQLTSQWWARPGAGPIRQASLITNQSGGPVKIFYLPSLAMHLTAPQAALPSGKTDPWWLWYFHSDGITPDKQGVYHEPITPTFDRTLRTHPDGALIPLAILGMEGRQGIYVGVEWSFGDIRLTGVPASNRPGVSLSAGNVLDFATTLAAGQVFEVPPCFIGVYTGDVDSAGNRLRKYLFRYSMPEILRRDSTYPKVQWNAFSATGKQPGSWECVERKYYPFVDDIAPLGFEEVTIDVGWWLAGEPESHPNDWPKGMKAAAGYAHQKGMRFGLYWSDNENMALPGGCSVRTERIRNLLVKHGADMWRSDCTKGTLIAHDYWAVKGFYAMVDRLQREIPAFQWENCSGGGRIKDYGAMKRCVKIFNSDTYSAKDVRRAFYDSSYAFHPIQLEGHLVDTDGRGRPQGIAGMRYAFRSASMGAPEWVLDAPNGANGDPPWTAEEKAAIKSAVATWKTKIRPLVRSADLYHIFPRPDDHVWDGIEYYDPVTSKGVVFLFKPDSPNDTQTVKLKGLDAHRTYRVTFADGSNPSASKAGAELLATGIDVTLKGKHISELMFFEVADQAK
jgi:hypothetical protein